MPFADELYILVYMFIVELSKTLKDFDVDFAIAGGYAVVLHGVVRGTVDIDLVIALNENNFEHAQEALHFLGLKSRLPITFKEVFHFRKEYIANRNLIAWSFTHPKNPAQVVDIIITHDLSKMSTVNVSLRGTKIPVLSKSVLIKMKKQAGRPQDLEDIRALEAIDETS